MHNILLVPGSWNTQGSPTCSEKKGEGRECGWDGSEGNSEQDVKDTSKEV